MKNLIFFMASVLLFLSITSCSEKSDSEEKSPNTDLFPVGYGFKWIYQNTDNISRQTYTYNFTMDKVGYFDIVKQEIYEGDSIRYPILKKNAEVFYTSSSNAGYVASDSGNYSVLGMTFIKHRSETRIPKLIMPGDTLIYNSFYRNNPIIGSTESTFKDKENNVYTAVQTWSVVASLVVNKVTYTNVYRYNLKITGTDSYNYDEFTYYVKGIGVVKRHFEGFFPGSYNGSNDMYFDSDDDLLSYKVD